MPTIPAAANADGNTRYDWVPAIPSPAAPSAATLNAGVPLSCYLTDDGWQPSMDQASTADNRICSTQDFEGAGRFTRGLSVKYVENPAVPTSNVAYTTLIPGTLGFIVERRGYDVDLAYAATQKVWVWPVQVGQRAPQPPEANSKLKQMQKMFVTGQVVEGTVAA